MINWRANSIKSAKFRITVLERSRCLVINWIKGCVILGVVGAVQGRGGGLWQQRERGEQAGKPGAWIFTEGQMMYVCMPGWLTGLGRKPNVHQARPPAHTSATTHTELFLHPSWPPYPLPLSPPPFLLTVSSWPGTEGYWVMFSEW